MADTKISDLTALTGAGTATGDLIPIVDISASATKNQSVAQLAVAFLAIGGIAPTASPTFTTALTAAAPTFTGTTTAATLTATGTTTLGTGAEAAAIKGIFISANVSVAVPNITDPDEAHVDVDVSTMTFAPAVGDAVIVIPVVALPSNCNLLGAWVSNTDQVTITYGSEGGNVTGASKNHKFLFFDLT